MTRRDQLPGEDWEFFAAFNAVTEAYDFLKRQYDNGPVPPDSLEQLSFRFLRIVDTAQRALSGQLDRASVAHARARICLHHVMKFSTARLEEEMTATAWDVFEQTHGATVERLLRLSVKLLGGAE